MIRKSSLSWYPTNFRGQNDHLAQWFRTVLATPGITEVEWKNCEYGACFCAVKLTFVICWFCILDALLENFFIYGYETPLEESCLQAPCKSTLKFITEDFRIIFMFLTIILLLQSVESISAFALLLCGLAWWLVGCAERMATHCSCWASQQVLVNSHMFTEKKNFTNLRLFLFRYRLGNIVWRAWRDFTAESRVKTLKKKLADSHGLIQRKSTSKF